MNVRRVFGIVALAMTAVAVSACGNYVNDNTGDDYGIEVATQSLVTNMSYQNTDTGTVFTWDGDGSSWYRVQIPNVLITTQLSSTECGCDMSVLCSVTLPIPWTSTNKWYVQGSFDAPKWASSSYAPTNSVFQPRPAGTLDTDQTGNRMTFKWVRSEYPASFRLQVVPFHIGTYSLAEANCDGATDFDCEVTLTLPFSTSGNWYVQTNGTGPVGPWIGSTYTVTPTPTTLAKPTGLNYQQGATGVTFSWNRVPDANHYRLQVPNRFITLYTAAQVGCEAGQDTCSIVAPLPASSGTWYVQAKYIDAISDPPVEVSSAWAGIAYEITPDGCAAAPPTDLQFAEAYGLLTFTWTKSEGAVEYTLQAVNQFYKTYQAADIGCGVGGGNTCTVTEPSVWGTSNLWYVKARGVCTPNTALWSDWASSTYTSTAYSTFVGWNFDDELEADRWLASIGTGTASGGSGLTTQAWTSGYPGYALSYAGWSTTLTIDLDDYFQFSFDSTGRSEITLSFDHRRSATGPRAFAVAYSTDGQIFTDVQGSATVLPDIDTMQSHKVQLPAGAEGAATLTVRLYGYNSEGAAGTWRIDNVLFKGYAE